MDKKCVIGLFLHFQTARQLREGLINSGYEDFDISIIAGDEFKIMHYAPTFGPFKGVTTEDLRQRIVHLGFGTDLAREYEANLKDGYTLLAIAVDEEDLDDIIQIFAEHSASDIQVSE